MDYKITCDETNNSSLDQAQGKLNVDIEVCPPKKIGIATVEMDKQGHHVLRLSGEVTKILFQKMISKHGSSTKRINKKRFKRYILNLIVDTSMDIVNKTRTGEL